MHQFCLCHCFKGFFFTILLLICFDLQEENNNNNNLPNQHAVNDDDYNNDNTTQLLQNLTASQNTALQNHDTNDSLLALAVALRSAANVSPDQQQSLRQHLSMNRNFTTTTSQSIADKLLAPSISDLDSLAINNRPHKPPDLKGKWKPLYPAYFNKFSFPIGFHTKCRELNWTKLRVEPISKIKKWNPVPRNVFKEFTRNNCNRKSRHKIFKIMFYHKYVKNIQFLVRFIARFFSKNFLRSGFGWKFVQKVVHRSV